MTLWMKRTQDETETLKEILNCETPTHVKL